MTPSEARLYIASADPTNLLVSTQLSDGEAVAVAAAMRSHRSDGVVAGLFWGLVLAGAVYGGVRYGLPALAKRGLLARGA